MGIEPGALIVIALYGLCLFVIWRVAPRLPGIEPQAPAPWWRDVRLWASFVAVAQIVVYALFS
jgi:hypothetical protein